MSEVITRMNRQTQLRELKAPAEPGDEPHRLLKLLGGVPREARYSAISGVRLVQFVDGILQRRGLPPLSSAEVEVFFQL